MGLDWNLSKKDDINGSVGFNHFANRNKGNYDQYFIQYDAAGNAISNSNSVRIADTKCM